jgi:hypothetical protein
MSKANKQSSLFTKYLSKEKSGSALKRSDVAGLDLTRLWHCGCGAVNCE